MGLTISVDFVQRDQLRAIEQRHLTFGNRVRREFTQDDVEVGERVASGVEGRAVDHVQQRGTAFDVSQELEPESFARARPLDESRHVGDREARRSGLDDTEVRVQGRERVVGDLGSGGGNRGDEG
jgi:hypothetical protein